MPQTIEVPGYGDVEFPDGMSDDQISAAIRQNMPQAAPTRYGSGNSFDNTGDGLVPSSTPYGPEGSDKWMEAGRNVGEAGLKFGTGLVGYTAGNAAGLGALGYDSVANAVMHPLSGGTPGDYADPTAVRQRVSQALTYQPQDSNSLSSKLVDLPSRIIGEGGKGLAQVTHTKDVPYLGSIVEALPEAGLNALGLKAALAPTFDARPFGGPKNAPMPKEIPGLSTMQPEAVPTKEALKKASGDAYKRSEQIGAVVNEGRFAGFQKELADTLSKEGIDATLHPDATAALKRITAEKGPMTLEKIETLRRIAQDAEGSIKPADARKAGQMVDAIDDLVDNLKPEDLGAGTPEAAAALKDARGLWSRARKADILDELMRKAEHDAPKFSASGMENAIRTQFRGLAKNEKRFRRFTKEEQEAISRVAKGGPMDNAMRMIGKFVPAGPVSTGVGAGLGFLMGGPAGAAAVPAVGALGRFAASRMTNRNAALANELVRRGPLPSAAAKDAPKATANPVMQQHLENLLKQPKPRDASAVMADIQSLEARARSLTPDQLSDGATVQAISQAWDRLQAELAQHESRAKRP